MSAIGALTRVLARPDKPSYDGRRMAMGHFLCGLVLLGSDPSAFLCDGAFHQQYNKLKRDHDNGQHSEHIEAGGRRYLLLAQVCERLQGQLLHGDRIAGLLHERSGSLIKEGTRSRVERIERFAKTEAVELITALLHRLS
jgi:hypothetical protein